MSLPVVAIIGRPNVGKSSLFNRFAGKKVAVISEEAGTTRDRIFAKIEKADLPFIAVDTGGIELGIEGDIEENMQHQTRIAIDEADLILFLTDSRTEITSEDREVIDILRKKTNKPVIFAISKCDSGMSLAQKVDFLHLGFGEPLAISTTHKIGMTDLYGEITKKLRDLGYKKSEGEKVRDENIVANIALIGRPNTGKSSLVNAFLSEERLIVSPISGTTRDAIDTEINWEGKTFNLIDTAGVRRSGKIQDKIEKYSIIRTARAIEKSDVCCILLDPEEGVTSQDQSIVRMALDAKKGIILVVNKWDLIEKGEEAREQFFNHLRNKFPFMPWAPVVFLSAKTKRGIVKLFPLAEEITEERRRKITTGKLNNFIEKIQREHGPTGTKSIKPKIFYMTQIGIEPPHFKIFVNKNKYFHFSYFRYIENRLREIFGYGGTAIEIETKDRESIYQK